MKLENFDKVADLRRGLLSLTTAHEALTTGRLEVSAVYNIGKVDLLDVLPSLQVRGSIAALIGNEIGRLHGELRKLGVEVDG